MRKRRVLQKSSWLILAKSFGAIENK